MERWSDDIESQRGGVVMKWRGGVTKWNHRVEGRSDRWRVE